MSFNTKDSPSEQIKFKAMSENPYMFTSIQPGSFLPENLDPLNPHNKPSLEKKYIYFNSKKE